MVLPQDGFNATSSSKWKERRQRRRERQRAVKEEERESFKVEGGCQDENTTNAIKWSKTHTRMYQSAIRTCLKEMMVTSSWSNNESSSGLQIVIDLGMDELMSDTEIKSL
eukprot:98328-Ditylum_brightwellii.AAC.1